MFKICGKAVERVLINGWNLYGQYYNKLGVCGKNHTFCLGFTHSFHTLIHCFNYIRVVVLRIKNLFIHTFRRINIYNHQVLNKYFLIKLGERQ